MKSHLKLMKPDAENRAVAPRRLANSKYRSREHLTQSEVEKLIEAAKTNRHGHRDTTMLLVAYRHGLRASELCGLEWSQVDFNGATLHVRRAKNGKAATHPIRGDEMRALRKLQREAPKSPFVFVNERGAPFSPDGWTLLMNRARRRKTGPKYRVLCRFIWRQIFPVSLHLHPAGGLCRICLSCNQKCALGGSAATVSSWCTIIPAVRKLHAPGGLYGGRG